MGHLDRSKELNFTPRVAGSGCFNVIGWQTDTTKLIPNVLYQVRRRMLSATAMRYAGCKTFPSGLTGMRDQYRNAKWVVDLSASYNVSRWTFTLGADNAPNTDPDKASPSQDKNRAFPCYESTP
ncbi:MAG: hypothetical protein ABI379_00570 [Rhodanobacter sp.]